MSLLAVVVLAVVTWAGAVLAVDGPIMAGALVAVVGWSSRRSALLIIGAFVVAGGLSAGAWAELRSPLPDRFDGPATVVSDPTERFGSMRAVMASSEGRFELRARGAAAGRLGRVEVGQRVHVTGHPRPWRGSRSRQAALNLRGTISVETLELGPGGRWYWRLVNGYRHAVSAGGQTMGPGRQALFTGLVYGDDRDQGPETRADFQAAGLTHLLAVSGQNVAFVLALAKPVLARFGYRMRFVGVLAVLLLFGAATRYEPSVLRATAMAAVAALGDFLGRDVDSRRALALAVTGLVLYQPLLVHSLGFQLSVAASAGIAFGSGRLAAAIPGPRVVAETVAVTITAQLAVAPLLVFVFGPVPLMALPANVVGAPVAGPVMIWGLTVGFAAGLFGGPVAEVLMLPVEPLLWWLERVAQRSAAAPVGRIGLIAALALGGAALVTVAGRRRVAVLVVAAVVVVSGSPPAPGLGTHSLGVGARLWLGCEGSVVGLEADADAAVVLDRLRQAGVGAVDVIVVLTGSERAAGVVGTLRRRLSVGEVWAAASVRVPGSRWPDEAVVSVPPWRIDLGDPGEAVVEIVAGSPCR